MGPGKVGVSVWQRILCAGEEEEEGKEEEEESEWFGPRANGTHRSGPQDKVSEAFVAVGILQSSEDMNREDEGAAESKTKQQSQGQGQGTTNLGANYCQE